MVSSSESPGESPSSSLSLELDRCRDARTSSIALPWVLDLVFRPLFTGFTARFFFCSSNNHFSSLTFFFCSLSNRFSSLIFFLCSLSKIFCLLLFLSFSLFSLFLLQVFQYIILSYADCFGIYSVFPNLCINNQRKAQSRFFLPLIEFVLH